MKSTPAAKNRQREKALLLIFCIVSTFAFIPTFSTDVEGAFTPASTINAEERIATLEQLQHDAPSIRSALLQAKQLWDTTRAGMLQPAPVAVLLGAVSQSLADLAVENGVDFGVPSVSLDSTRRIWRVRSRGTLRGDPESVVLFLDALSSQPTRMRVRELQLIRVSPSATDDLGWSGTIEIELLASPYR